MSRLSRLRSFWRSLRRGKVRDGDWSPHRAVNLLPAEYRDTGTLRTDGSGVLSASTGTKERGTRTPATATTAVSSFSSKLGGRWEVVGGQIWLVQGSKRFGPFSSIREMAAPGASGVPLASAD